MKALIVIDVQIDFMPGGTLPVAGGDEVVPAINNIITDFDVVIATQDWHPKTHQSFSSNHPGKKPFDVICLNKIEQTLWPDHCVQGSRGAEFHPKLNNKPIQVIFRKGMNPKVDSYSAFYDNQRLESTGLSGYLQQKKVHSLYFCGLAADVCVYYSIKDALDEGINCTLIESATRALDPHKFARIKKELLAKNVTIID